MGTNEFEQRIEPITGDGLRSAGIDIVQVNVGLRCNQRCAHCHLQCSPNRTEEMDWPTMESIVDISKDISCSLVDLTGGSPELNPNFCRFIEALRKSGLNVQVRTNLTVMLEPGMEKIPEFLREHGVRLVASMPCYTEENVRAQRGRGVYEKSVEMMRRLNALGYGVDPNLPLNLVYNPLGAFLPAEQSSLEADYRRELGERFGIKFTHLLTITNMPIGRFGQRLCKEGQDEDYMCLLKESFNSQTIDGLMCRHQLSIGWDGTLYDCDFNLALGMPVNHGAPDHINKFDRRALTTRRIFTGNHCFGCTAGCGSSCRGALDRSNSPKTEK